MRLLPLVMRSTAWAGLYRWRGANWSNTNTCSCCRLSLVQTFLLPLAPLLLFLCLNHAVPERVTAPHAVADRMWLCTVRFCPGRGSWFQKYSRRVICDKICSWRVKFLQTLFVKNVEKILKNYEKNSWSSLKVFRAFWVWFLQNLDQHPFPLL